MRADIFPRWLVAAACSLGCDSAESPAALAERGPLYAITTQVLAPPATFTSYVVLTDSLRDARQLALSDALELPGRAQAVGAAGAGGLFVLDGEAPRLTRYDLSPEGVLRPGAVLSFAAYGISWAPATMQQFVFVDETRAYYLDASTLQLFVWDPRAMTITATLALEGLEREGFAVMFGTTPFLREETLFFAAAYFSSDDQVYDRESRLVAVDTRSLRVQSVVSEQRCAFLAHVVRLRNGDAYFGSDALTAAAARRLGSEHGGPACALRLPATDDSWDSTVIGFAERVGSATAGSFIASGETHALVRVLDESLVPELDALTVPELRAGPYWRWASLDLTSTTPAALLDLEPSAAAMLQYPVDGETFTNRSDASFAATTIVQVAPDGSVQSGPTLAGTVVSIVHVR